MIFVKRTVEGICAALRDQVHLRARRTSGGCVIIAGGYAKFLERIQGRAHGAFEGIALELIVVVQAIQRNVRLVAARTVYRAAAAVIVLLGVGGLADIDDAGLQAEN